MRAFKKQSLDDRTHKSHCKSYIFCLVFFILLATSHTSSCQLLDSLSLDTTTACTSIKEAMADTGSIIKLDLSKQKLKSFPEEIRKLHNLQYLDLSKNKITEVPDWIGELKNLQFLILSKNKIEQLPAAFCELANLKYFIMNRSELQALPHCIGDLKELRCLDLWDDNLSYFPPELKDLNGTLQTLDLRDVLISKSNQAALKALLPNTTIYFSPSCPCEQ